MAYDPKAIANYFIDRAKLAGEELTPMKLQKLVYFAHGWYLALKDEELINEKIEAWRFGPVVRSLYHEFSYYGRNPITEKAFIHDFSDDYAELPEGEEHRFVRAFLDRAWDVYGKYSAIQLSNATHVEGSPWDKIRKKYPDGIPECTVIDNETIKQYFEEGRKETTKTSD